MGRFYEDIRVLGGTATFGTLTASNTGNILEVDGNVGVYKVSSYLNLGLSPTFETQYESTSNSGIEIGTVLTTRPNLSGDNTGFQIGGAGILYWDDTNDSTNLNGLMGMAGEIYVNSTSSTIAGAIGVASVLINQSAGGTISNAYGFRSFWNEFVTHNGWTDNYYGFYMSNPDGNNSNIGNKYGVYINDSNASNIFLGPIGAGGITSPNYEIEVSGTVSTTGFRMTNGASSGYILESDASGNATWVAPSTGGGGVTGSGTTNYIPRWTGTDTLSSTGSIYDDGTNVFINTTSDVATGTTKLTILNDNTDSTNWGAYILTNGSALSNYGLGITNQNTTSKAQGIQISNSHITNTGGNRIGIVVQNGNTSTSPVNSDIGYQYTSNSDPSSNNYGNYFTITSTSSNRNYGGYYEISGSSVEEFGLRVNLNGSATDGYGYYFSDGGSYTTSYGSYISNNSTSTFKRGYYVRLTGNGLSTNNYGLDVTVNGGNSGNIAMRATVNGTYSGTNIFTGNIGLYLFNNGAAQYNTGIQQSVYNGTVNNIGVLSRMSGTSDSIPSNSDMGVYTAYGNGHSSTNSYGTYNRWNSNTNYTNRYGTYQEIRGNSSTTYGDYTVISIGTSTNIYGDFVSISQASNTSYGGYINVSSATNSIGLYIDSTGNSTSKALVTNRGESIFNENGGDYDFRIEGLTQSNLFFVDASTDSIGVGLNNPQRRFDIYDSTTSATTLRVSGLNNASYVAEILGGVSGYIGTAHKVLKLRLAAPTPANTAYFIGFHDSGDGLDGSISGDGAGGVLYNLTSDRRVKENIVDVGSTIDILNNIKVRRFNKIGSSVEEIGFIAQELYEVYPNAVSKTDDGVSSEYENPWGVDYSKLVPVLVKSLQEQQKEIEYLKTLIK